MSPEQRAIVQAASKVVEQLEAATVAARELLELLAKAKT